MPAIHPRYESFAAPQPEPESEPATETSSDHASVEPG
jgi:hypothetical protein